MIALALSTGKQSKMGDAKLGTGLTGSNGRQAYVGEGIYEANKVVTASNLAYLVQAGSVWWFDGTKSGKVARTTAGYPYDAQEVTVDPATSTVYTLDQEGIWKVTGTTRALVKSLQSGYDINTSNQFTVFNGVAYLGGSDSKLYSLPL